MAERKTAPINTELAAAAAARQSWTVIPARQLCGDHIGTLVRVRTWDNTTEIATLQTGEFRQVGHTGSSVYAHIGVGAQVEVTMDPDQPVTLLPPANYADVAELARYDQYVAAS